MISHPSYNRAREKARERTQKMREQEKAIKKGKKEIKREWESQQRYYSVPKVEITGSNGHIESSEISDGKQAELAAESVMVFVVAELTVCNASISNVSATSGGASIREMSEG